MEVIINGSLIFSPSDFYKQICSQMPELGEYFGCNLDALWDYIDLFDNKTIIWKDFSITEQNIGEYAHKILDLYRERSNYLISKGKKEITILLV